MAFEEDFDFGGSELLLENETNGPQATLSETPWIVVHFGFNTTTEYLDWIDQLSEQALMNHFGEVIDLLLGE